MLSNEPRGATVHARSPLDVQVASRDDFLALVGSFSELKRVFEELERQRRRNDA